MDGEENGLKNLWSEREREREQRLLDISRVQTPPNPTHINMLDLLGSVNSKYGKRTKVRLAVFHNVVISQV